MTHIVVGVDGSPQSVDALRWASREATLRESEVVAVMAWDFLEQHHAVQSAPFDPQYGDAQASEALDTYVREALGDSAGPEIGRRVVRDLPAPALLDAAAHAELLVVGARGLGGFRGLLLGSVSQHCIEHSPVPVAVVRDAGLPDRDPAASRIVVGVDGSEQANGALDWAVEEAVRRHAPLCVVHAWQAPFVGTPFGGAMYQAADFEAPAQRLLDAAVETTVAVDRLPTDAEKLLVYGGASDALLNAAKDADLLVVGSRGVGGFKGLLLGRVSHQVVHHAHCPVVMVPSERS